MSDSYMPAAKWVPLAPRDICTTEVPVLYSMVLIPGKLAMQFASLAHVTKSVAPVLLTGT
jgi:hypothetical protein